MSPPNITSILTAAIIELECAADLLESYAAEFYGHLIDKNGLPGLAFTDYIREMQDALRDRAEHLRKMDQKNGRG
jgi:hypothetical protein